MIPVAHLQAYLRHSAHQQYDAVSVPPFTLFFHPANALVYFNYAIPDKPISDNSGEDLREPLVALRATFAAGGRQPRFEFIEEYAPGLASALRIAGFIEEGRQQLMICTSDTYHGATAVAGLSITTLTSDSPLTDAQDFFTTQRRGFNSDDMASATEQEAQQFLQELRSGVAFLARLNRQPVGVGMFTEPFQGITEVVGIATRKPFRRQGVGSVLTARAVRTAFARGVKVVCLTAADKRAGRLYERVGFRPYATMLAYIDPAGLSLREQT